MSFIVSGLLHLQRCMSPQINVASSHIAPGTLSFMMTPRHADSQCPWMA